jgi:C1A family cysteine protease
MKITKLLLKIFNFFKNLFKKEQQKVETKPQIKFGWKKDPVDPRDKKFKITAPHTLPPSVDLRPRMPLIYNQLDIGSCVGNGVGGAIQFEQIKQGKKDFVPSRLFIYYGAREMEGTIQEDSGCIIRDAIKVVASQGVCPESMWVYDTKKFKDKPCPCCYKEALNNQVLEYLRISPHNLYEVQHCLSEGFPVICGIILYESFMSEEVAKTGIVPMPKPNEEVIGGHCVLIVGYDSTREMMLCRNSWGTEWGIQGYFWIPFSYIFGEEMSSDYWTIRLVE